MLCLQRETDSKFDCLGRCNNQEYSECTANMCTTKILGIFVLCWCFPLCSAQECGFDGFSCFSQCCCIPSLNLIDCLTTNKKLSVFPTEDAFPLTKELLFWTVELGWNCPIFVDIEKANKKLPDLRYINFDKDCKGKCVYLINGEPPSKWIWENANCFKQINGSKSYT